MKKQAKNQKRGTQSNMKDTPKASAGMKDKDMDKRNTTKTKETQKEGIKATKK